MAKTAKENLILDHLVYVRDGDLLHVHSIDRLARNLQDLLNIVAQLREKKVTLKFHKENLVFGNGSDAGQADAFQGCNYTSSPPWLNLSGRCSWNDNEKVLLAQRGTENIRMLGGSQFCQKNS